MRFALFLVLSAAVAHLGFELPVPLAIAAGFAGAIVLSTLWWLRWIILAVFGLAAFL